jgi:K+ transporter
MRERMAESTMPMEVFIKSASNSAQRVPGTAIFMASSTVGVPSAMLHNIKHNKILHERIIILTVEIQDVPYVDPSRRSECKDLGGGFHRVKLRYGFLEETNVPLALASVEMCGPPFDMMHTSFFLSHLLLRKFREWQFGARRFLHGCYEMLPMLWNFSDFLPTGLLNLEAKSKSDPVRTNMSIIRLLVIICHATNIYRTMINLVRL